MASTQEACPLPTATASAPAAVAAAAAPGVQVSSSDAVSSKPKPCCVCKEEKARRDDCMLFSKAADPQKDCQSTIDLYKSCMLGFGFKI